MPAVTGQAAVTANYGGGKVLARVLGMVEADGLDPRALRQDDLRRFDSMHIGGWQATEALLDPLGLAPGTRALDVGCGIGGAARTLAERYGAVVEAIDLTPELVTVAEALTAMTGTAGVRYQVASGTALPFEAGAFDLATLIHVGMNIDDKPTLFAEVARVLRPGGRFAVYDVMRTGPDEPPYPQPWAGTPAISFLEPPDAYARLAAAAGFVESARRERLDEGIAAVQAMGGVSAASRGMPEDRRLNILTALEAGTLAPVEMIFVKPI